MSPASHYSINDIPRKKDLLAVVKIETFSDNVIISVSIKNHEKQEIFEVKMETALRMVEEWANVILG